jgi:HEPN domain-containing protein
MNVSLGHLPSLKRQQVLTITQIVRKAVNPEKILLFGTYSDPRACAGLFVGDDPGAGAGLLASRQFPAELVTYDLLVVTRQGDHRSDYELQDIIENRCRGCAPVTVLVHDIQYMNSRLAEGHYFFTMIRREAILLYDAGLIPLAQAIRPDLEQIRKVAERDFERWKLQARAFFRSAVFNCQHKEWKIAAFLLHQSAEHIYQAILLAFTGYKPTTHNLDKLRRYTNRFSIELALLFPRDSEEEDRLFRLLLQGYVDARYKEDYSISEEEAGILTTRIDRLLSIAERVCRNRFISLEKMAAGR